ncbi:anti-sigma-factor antagonist [Actinoplanes sp. SE50]|uniref:STAS domain-containing protein n=1 Tax=unclassified Actinoplanes TaxID=2626549 RepID=UPI00023EC5C6|nr:MULTISPECIES: STAS domain-containing protein [unclassified Actinoplanes]AEV83616.1 Anti-sigma F factor antagonist [Actinoplanes sp. SE50/110]ATO82240.1 anti-sigma-factor antagonist [Actinoplanes sp. SE50]SLL99647.1 anti-sigma factor antagonist [Actinoplanes sp. SE50/110]
MDFGCTIERHGDRVVIVPEGDIDAESAAALRQVLRQAVETDGFAHVEVDLHRVSFLDSIGLGVFVAARKAAHARGLTFRLRDFGPMVKMLLQVTNLEETLATA